MLDNLANICSYFDTTVNNVTFSAKYCFLHLNIRGLHRNITELKNLIIDINTLSAKPENHRVFVPNAAVPNPVILGLGLLYAMGVENGLARLLAKVGASRSNASMINFDFVLRKWRYYSSVSRNCTTKGCWFYA